MAEIQEKSDKKSRKSAKVSTKIDMTPMVDLAFLLITFFMLTTTFSKPNVMEIAMPDKTETEDTAPVAASRCLTLILDKDQQVHWYRGMNNENLALQTTDFSNSEGIRQVIIKQTAEIEEKTGKDAIILIKATDQAKYKNLVDILDEMHITHQAIYAIVDVYDFEKQAIASL
jgi:biopolymer transport protein ExbD